MELRNREQAGDEAVGDLVADLVGAPGSGKFNQDANGGFEFFFARPLERRVWVVFAGGEVGSGESSLGEDGAVGAASDDCQFRFQAGGFHSLLCFGDCSWF